MLIVVALGGNALLRRGRLLTSAEQEHNVQTAAESIAEIADGNTLVITHGNGPQVGLLALNDLGFPLDVLGAESQGMIGYQVAQALGNALPAREVAAIVTRTRVDADDPAFALPTKPIGPTYDARESRRLAREHGWVVAPDGESFRRVVGSPRPVEIIELPAIRKLLHAGVLVVCAGGGGVPVVRTDDGLLGVEAVVDKDLTAALLAEQLGADVLLLLTDVDCVVRDWGTPDAMPLHDVSARELRALRFASGSMAPKVDAACTFVEHTGARAAIGSLADASGVLRGESGTQIASGLPASWGRDAVESAVSADAATGAVDRSSVWR